jgi:hypothetical protein
MMGSSLQAMAIVSNRAGVLLTSCLLLLVSCAAHQDRPKGAACPTYEQLRPMLNSERIESCFGSYGVEIVEQQGNLRISSLYTLAVDNPAIGRERGSLHPGDEQSVGESLAADIRTTRTLAISEFATDLPPSLDTAYQAIRGGASMGATLQAKGWRVDKRQRFLGEVPVSDVGRCMSGQAESWAGEMLAVQVYDLYVVNPTETVRFALLAELHDPRYLTLTDLQRIDGELPDSMQQPDAAWLQLLQQAAPICATQ